MKQLAALLVGSLLASALSGCTELVPDPPDPAPATRTAPNPFLQLPADCPHSGALAESVRLGEGSEAQLAADLLAAVDQWVNAGSAMLTNEPQWVDSSVPDHCLADLAQVIGAMHAGTLVAGGGDPTTAAFQRTIIKENLLNLQTARAQGRASDVKRELMVLQQGSRSAEGAFLNLIVRRVNDGEPTPRAVEEWTVILAPQGSQLFIFHVERKDVKHGSYSW